jgi:methyl-accepting chemotaxis protein
MSRQLTQVTENLGASGQEVSQISTSMSDSASALSSASSEAAASLEETSAAVEELSSTLQLSSENATKAKELSTECVVSAQLGQKQVDGLSQNIQNIAASSKKMEEITGVIDDIAFQTNLLALNAAVEAARAGEHGKGFSVVAEAVRTLAQKCAVSAKEISDLIHANVEQIQEGSKQMQASGESLKSIVGVVEKVNALNSEIASMAKEQALGISDINKAIQQLDTVTQRNAQASEDSEHAAQALTEQSRNLYNSVQEISAVVLGGSWKKAGSAENASDTPAHLKKPKGLAQKAAA